MIRYLAGVAMALVATAAQAQAGGAGPGRATPPSEPGWGVSVTEENDFFDFYDNNTDRYYTQGVKLSVRGPDASFGVLKRVLRDHARLDDPTMMHTTVGIGQHMYTPEDLLIPVPDPQDRPYAGWAYLSTAAFAHDTDDLYSLEAQLGVVGPSAHAGEAQNGLHRLKEAAESLGWDHQLKDEPGFNLYGEHRRRMWQADDRSVEIMAVQTLAVGTVETSIGGGLVARIGFNLDQDFGPQRLRSGPAASDYSGGTGDAFYFFGGLHVRGVVHDVFLDGNVFKESPSVDKKPIVPEVTLGVSWTTGQLLFDWMPPVRISYAHVWQGEQFVGQNGPLEFGSLTLSFVIGGAD